MQDSICGREILLEETVVKSIVNKFGKEFSDAMLKKTKAQNEENNQNKVCYHFSFLPSENSTSAPPSPLQNMWLTILPSLNLAQLSKTAPVDSICH